MLLVDDLAENLVALEALLRAPGVRVLTADSGDEALELLLEHDVALALLDVQMPGMDGFELAELMRGAERTRRHADHLRHRRRRDPRRAFRGYEAGAVDFLYKPIEPHMLAARSTCSSSCTASGILLQERNEALEGLLKLNETMIAVLSHDLRNAAVGSDAVGRGVAAQRRFARQRQTADRILSSGTRMARMIEQLLDFSSIRSGVLRLQKAPVDLAEVCRGVAAEFAAPAHAGEELAYADESAGSTAGVTLETRGDLRAQLDSGRIAQVFSNLARNALQHGERGAPVRLELDGDDPAMIVACVSNRGELPQDRIAGLFEPFKGSHDQGGLGLGLFIVDQFVRAHGGRITVESARGEVRFWVTLPRGDAGARAAAG